MGAIAPAPLPTYPDGLPRRRRAGARSARPGGASSATGPYNGIAAIDDFGAEHLRGGALILYTSQDSVLQIAAHVDAAGRGRAVRGLRRGARGDDRRARRRARHRAAVRRRAGRLRAHGGAPRLLGRAAGPHVPRRAGRRRRAGARGRQGVRPLRRPRDLGARIRARRTSARCARRRGSSRELDAGLVFTNLVETDQVYGHRKDVDGLPRARCARSTRAWGSGSRRCGPATCSSSPPTTAAIRPRAHSDHTREYVPLLACFDGHGGRRHDGALADVGASVLRWLPRRDAPALPGTPFVERRAGALGGCDGYAQAHARASRGRDDPPPARAARRGTHAARARGARREVVRAAGTRSSCATRSRDGVVERLSRRGKYLIWEAEDEVYLLMHLRMTGTVLYDPPPDTLYTRVRLELDDGHVPALLRPAPLRHRRARARRRRAGRVPRRAPGRRAARAGLHDGAPVPADAQAAHADQGAAARPAARRGRRQHLRQRGAVPRAHPPAARRGRAEARAGRGAARRRRRVAGGRPGRRRRVDRRLPPPRRGQGRVPERVPRPQPRGRAVHGLRHARCASSSRPGAGRMRASAARRGRGCGGERTDRASLARRVGLRRQPRHRVAAGSARRFRSSASASQIRPPWASMIAREIARPRPAPPSERALRSPPWKNGSKTRSRSSGAIPGPESATSISIASSVAGTGADDDAAVGRRVADRVLDEVEQHPLDLLGVGLRGGEPRRELGVHDDRAGLGVRAHRVDRLLDELVEHDALHRPVDVAGLQPRQLEEVVDQRAQRVHVGRDPPEVLAAHRRVGDEVVVDRVDEQPQRGQRRAQVVRDRRRSARAARAPPTSSVATIASTSAPSRASSSRPARFVRTSRRPRPTASSVVRTASTSASARRPSSRPAHSPSAHGVRRPRAR